MARNVVKGITLAAVLALFLWGNGYLLAAKHYWFYSQLGGQSESDLKSENMSLRIELEKYLSLKDNLARPAGDGIRALVYSSYPFNDKSEIIINVGEDDGVAPKMAVLSGNLFLGKVDKVYKNESIVKTIYDRSFEIPVKLGDKGINALLRGGPEPKITLIPKEADVRNGGGVYSASADMPFGMSIGELRNIKEDSGDAWKEADLSLPYDINFLTVVYLAAHQAQ